MRERAPAEDGPPSAAYLRVSSRSQSVETQRAELQRMAKARGDRIEVWYQEAESAKRMARPELDRLRRDAHGGRVGRVYVYRLDRLTRTGIRDTLGLLEEFRAAGVVVLSAADGFDLSGPFSDVVVAVIAWAAQMERLAIGERIAAARRRLEEQGRSWGRPARQLSNAAITLAESQLADGVSQRQVAKSLGVPRTNLQRALKRARRVAQNPPSKNGPQVMRKAHPRRGGP
jgi:DNA invertase Pin-like site-specific DNA recombinase